MAKNTKVEKDTLKKDSAFKDYILAVGRRKNATALVRLYKDDVTLNGISVKKGEVVVNKKSAIEYFGKNNEVIFIEPIRSTNTQDKFAISIKVTGGGKIGQLEAVVLAIARALDKFDREKYRKILKRKGLLTRDSRVRQRRKVGMGGKSRRVKQSPKR